MGKGREKLFENFHENCNEEENLLSRISKITPFIMKMFIRNVLLKCTTETRALKKCV